MDVTVLVAPGCVTVFVILISYYFFILVYRRPAPPCDDSLTKQGQKFVGANAKSATQSKAAGSKEPSQLKAVESKDPSQAKAAGSTTPAEHVASDVKVEVPPISPHELDAREAERLARMASRKSNRQRLFAVASAIREASGLSVDTVDEEDAELLEEYNRERRSREVKSSTTAPVSIPDAPTAPLNAILPLDKFEVLSLGNPGDAPNTTDRRAPGQERPMKLEVGPVRCAVPLPCAVDHVECSFAARGFDLSVTDAGTGRRRRLKITNLEREINTKTSSWSLKPNKKKVLLTLQKVDLTVTWHNIQGDMHRKTHDALKKAKKKAEMDPMAAMASVLDDFCSALPAPSSREAEEDQARGLQQRVMMGIEAALQKTELEAQKMGLVNENMM